MLQVFIFLDLLVYSTSGKVFHLPPVNKTGSTALNSPSTQFDRVVPIMNNTAKSFAKIVFQIVHVQIFHGCKLP